MFSDRQRPWIEQRPDWLAHPLAERDPPQLRRPLAVHAAPSRRRRILARLRLALARWLAR
jgi:hypothetical protein